MASELPVTIRSARPDEIDEILKVWRDAGLGIRPGDAPGSLESLLAHDPESLLVAEEDGRIVGTLIAVWDGWRAGLYRLGVHPDFRRRGIGTALVHAGEQRLAARGATRIIAAVGRENSAATRFWKSVGYDVQDVYRLFKDIG